MPTESLRFPRGVVASPHHVASSAGAAVLRSGGNAVDAAVAANLVLGVVTPYHCGPGGDLFAIVVADGEVAAYASNGGAPAGATPQQIAEAAGSEEMPATGVLPVTVPGAVAGWFELLDRHGSMRFGDVARDAIDLARDGFVVSGHAAEHFRAPRERYADQQEWQERFGDLERGDRLMQPEMARTIEVISAEGPGAVYGGVIGQAIVETLQAGGSAMTLEDLRDHECREVTPLRGRFGDVEVCELPPPTQGVTALTALGLYDRLRAGTATAVDDLHLQIEAVRAALADREEHVTDPDHMRATSAALLDDERLDDIAASVDPERTSSWPPARPAPGGTAYLCAADRDGTAISLIQSNYMGFGSGVVVPGWGINLQNRGAAFSLDPDHVNVIAPGKRTLHTLIPGLVLRDGEPWLVFGTMGGDGQPQIHLQVLRRLLLEGAGLAEALDAPRFVVSPADGAVVLEDRFEAETVDALRDRGHDLTLLGDYEHVMGHAHAIELAEDDLVAAADPRSEGAALGW
ncbi:MAG: gamma-glutamyltransferase family protein [Nitriliruptorales bacterium]|nr:gamma-glutamyltransferase family protein [Nitriliruptorales bacterium]